MRFGPVLALAALAAFPPAQAGAAPDLVRTLPNKVTVVVREVHTRPIVSIQAWVRAGSRDEAVKDRGIAAVSAQCVMNATTRRTSEELQKEVYALGGSYQSEAGYDYSYFDLSVPARHLGQGLGLLSEGLIQARLDGPAVNQAIGRVQSRARTTLADADRASVNALRAELHRGTPLVSPLAVPEQEFSAITPTLIQRFHRNYYIAENLTVVVTGDVSAEDVPQMVGAAFQNIAHGRAASRARFSVRSIQGPRALIVRNPQETRGAAVAAGFPAPVWGSADALALDVLLAVLFDSPASRAHRRLGAGNAEFLRAIAVSEYETDGGTIALSLSADPGRLLECEGALLSLVEQARSTPISTEEFEEAVRTVGQLTLLPRVDLNGVGRATALAVLRGAPGSDEVYAQRLKAVRPEDLIGVARKYLDLRRAVFTEFGPDSSIASAKSADLERRLREKQTVYEAAYRTGPQVVASADADRTARVDAPLRAISRTPLDAGRGRVVRTVLAGGARLLTSEDHSAPLVTVAVYLSGGVRYENDNSNGITSLVRETLLNSNDPKEKGLTYRQSLSSMGTLVSHQDRDMWGCSITLPSDSWRDALSRVGSMFSHPDVDTINVDASRIYVLEALDRWLHDDQAQRERLIFPTKYQVSGYRLPALGTHRTLVRIPHTDVEDFCRRFIVQPNMVICLFGDLSASEAQSAVEAAFKDVSTKPFLPGSVAKEGEFEGIREKSDLGQGTNSTVTLAFNGPPARSPDVSVFYVVASLLSGPKGWFEEYIIKTGGAKGANAIVSQALDESPIIASVLVGGPLQEEDMVRLLYRQFKKAALLQLVGDLAPDLENAKTHAAASCFMSLGSDRTRALQFGRAELFGLGVDYPILLPARIDGVTSEDLLRVGLKYFQKDQWIRAPHAICETRPGGW